MWSRRLATRAARPVGWGRGAHARAMHARAGACNDGVRFAVVGDVHDRWCNDADGAALRALGADHAIWVGDIGNNENLGLVTQIANLDFPKSVILGNHDAWNEMSARRKAAASKRARVTEAPADALRAAQHITPPSSGCNGSSEGSAGGSGEGGPPRSLVQQQLDVLGDAHVGYRAMQIEGGDITIVGARPFSKGGGGWSSIGPFMSAVCGIGSFEESASRIVEAAAPAAARGDAIVVVAHNGPAGLGARRQDICGVDWKREQSDHGDVDLQMALDEMAQQRRPAAAVVFGHMHHTLRGGGMRRMVHVDPETGTTYLNAATVPRVSRTPAPAGGGPNGAAAGGAAAAAAAATLHHFLVFEMRGGAVETAKDVWVRVSRRPAAGGAGSRSGSGAAGAALAWEVAAAEVESESEVLRTVHSENGTVRMVWDASEQRWDAVALPAKRGEDGSGGGGSNGDSGNGNGGGRNGGAGEERPAAGAVLAGSQG